MTSAGAHLVQPEAGRSTEIDPKEGQKDIVDPGTSGPETTTRNPEEQPLHVAQDKVVYLTADTEDELTELKPDEVYIIGGICDHNRYKVKVVRLS